MAERNCTKVTGREIVRGRHALQCCASQPCSPTTNEPLPPLTDAIPNEISTEVPEVPAPSFAQSCESQTSYSGEVSLPVSSQESSSPSGSEPATSAKTL